MFCQLGDCGKEGDRAVRPWRLRVQVIPFVEGDDLGNLPSVRERGGGDGEIDDVCYGEMKLNSC